MSCDNRRTETTEQVKKVGQRDTINANIVADTIRKGDCHFWLASADSTLPTGDYVKYVTKRGRVKVVWGSKKFKRTLTKDYDCNGAPSGVPYIQWATSKYIGLRYGCGLPCWGTLILPLNLTDSVIERMYHFDFDTHNNQVVYLDNENYKQLIVENWKTGRKTQVKFKVICDCAFPGDCIEAIKIRNGVLFVKWKEFIRDKNEWKKTSETIKVGL